MPLSGLTVVTTLLLFRLGEGMIDESSTQASSRRPSSKMYLTYRPFCTAPSMPKRPHAAGLFREGKHAQPVHRDPLCASWD
ncbi:hypothetical protein C2E23DRAFT_304716 [Lenzites betulinus]|nr:hypothetical protein C2E23DRAFT_304716 [Lenzites betulinus]